eukprot:9114536-Pyramimonas_sp.AAC.1
MPARSFCTRRSITLGALENAVGPSEPQNHVGILGRPGRSNSAKQAFCSRPPRDFLLGTSS